MISLSKTRFSLEYRRFGADPVRISGHLAELSAMARQLKRLGHLADFRIRDSITGRFVRQY